MPILPGFCNDHDSLPLLSQLTTCLGSRPEMVYVPREPGEVVIDFLVMR